MNDRQRRESEMISRSNDFLAERETVLAANSIAAAKITRLKIIVANIERNREEQIANPNAARMYYDLSDDAHDDARDLMQDFADFARTIARDVPAFDGRYRMPRTGSKRNLIAAGRVFADHAAEDAATFTEYGLPEDSATNLREKLTTLEISLSNAQTAKAGGVGSTEELAINLKEGRELIAALDPIIRMTFRSDAATLAAWDYASHTERDPQRKKDLNPPA